MKSIKILAVALSVILMGSLSANAQKIAVVDGDMLIYSHPDTKGIQQKFQKWQTDSIGGAYNKLLGEYQEKDSILKKTTAPSVKQLLEKDLGELSYNLQNWQQIAGQASQAKNAEMMAPVNKKIMDAINVVAKEKGYTYVMTPDTFIVYPPTDNITQAVATKLNIKLPPQAAAGKQ